MGQISASRILTYTDQDIQRMSDLEFGGSPLVLYDQTGNPSVLPSRDPKAEVDFLLHIDAMFRWLATKAFDAETTAMLGSFTEYVWTATTGATFLPWSAVSGSRPANDGQILLFVGGQLIKDYTVSATGITLGTALTSGQSILASVMSAALATAHTDLIYLGVNGTGADHKVWALHSIGADKDGIEPTVPTSAAKCFVFRNGLRQIPGVGVTVSVGSGTCTATFIDAVEEDDYITFLIWSA